MNTFGLPSMNLPAAQEPFIVSTKLIEGCMKCGKMDNLSRCAACKVVFYCGKGHQTSDRTNHASFCNRIKKARAVLNREETELRNFPGDILTPANPFEEAPGHFWGIHETRAYMRARFAVVDAQLNKINTKEAVSTSLDHLLDMLRLCRGDNMGNRDLVPALYLRLGRDQEAYDFLKWYATTAQGKDYDWGDMDEPFLDVKGADAFEDPKPFVKESFAVGVSGMVTLVLLKIRMVMDLETLQKKRGETQDGDVAVNLVSSIVKNDPKILEREDHSEHIAELKKQIKVLYDATAKINMHMWDALRKPGKNLTTRPMLMSWGGVEEMQLKLQYSYNAWSETPGSFAYIEQQ